MPAKKITWETFDHIKEERSSDWFWVVGIIAVGMIVLAIFFGNILFALLIALAVFSSFMLVSSVPRIINYEVSRKGLLIKDILYPYSTLESFWVVDEDGFERDRILFKSNKLLMPLIVVPVGDAADLEDLRDFLLEYLEEEELEEPAAQKIMSRLGS